MQIRKNLHLPDNWYYKKIMIHKNNLLCFVFFLQEIGFLVPIGPIKGVLSKFLNSDSQGQLFLTIKVELGGCSQEYAYRRLHQVTASELRCLLSRENLNSEFSA